MSNLNLADLDRFLSSFLPLLELFVFTKKIEWETQKSSGKVMAYIINSNSLCYHASVLCYLQLVNGSCHIPNRTSTIVSTLFT